jgi:hypothetical protein
MLLKKKGEEYSSPFFQKMLIKLAIANASYGADNLDVSICNCGVVKS